MKKQELQAVQELYNLVHQWREKYTVGWVGTSDQFKRFYRGVTHLKKSLEVLTNTEYLPRPTVEEKVANAVFYVEDGVQYTVECVVIEEKYFTYYNSDTLGDEYTINFDSVPADAYFLGTIRL
jgi:hypothetical protein